MYALLSLKMGYSKPIAKRFKQYNYQDVINIKITIFLLNLKIIRLYMWDALRDLVPFAQFKKKWKTPMAECY